jgi:AcrR family transcriptional regulator
MPRSPGVDGKRLIVEAASRLFYARGVEAVSVEQVAEAAGLTKRAVYYHFPTKDDLVHAWLRAAEAPALALLTAGVDAAHSPEPHPIGRAIDTLGKWMRTPRFHGCAFLNASRDRPTDPTVVGLARAAKAHALEWLVGLAEREGAPDPMLRARQYLMLLDAMLATGHLYPPDDVVRTAKATLAAILATSPATRARPTRRGDPR